MDWQWTHHGLERILIFSTVRILYGMTLTKAIHLWAMILTYIPTTWGISGIIFTLTSGSRNFQGSAGWYFGDQSQGAAVLRSGLYGQYEDTNRPGERQCVQNYRGDAEDENRFIAQCRHWCGNGSSGILRLGYRNTKAGTASCICLWWSWGTGWIIHFESNFRFDDWRCNIPTSNPFLVIFHFFKVLYFSTLWNHHHPFCWQVMT